MHGRYPYALGSGHFFFHFSPHVNSPAQEFRLVPGVRDGVQLLCEPPAFNDERSH
jgi:hypothetical protein